MYHHEINENLGFDPDEITEWNGEMNGIVGPQNGNCWCNAEGSSLHRAAGIFDINDAVFEAGDTRIPRLIIF